MKTKKKNPIVNNPVAKFAGLFNKACVVESKKRYNRVSKHRASLEAH